MPFPTVDIIGILKDNLELRKSVLPISPKAATRWAKGLDIPKNGETVIYTGFMYQLVPYINATVKYAEKYGDSSLAKFTKLGRTLNKIVNLTSFMSFFSKIEETEYNEILRAIAQLLKSADVEFGYMYEDELYTGALLYDLGVDDSFKKHAEIVYNTIKKSGIKKLITVDPHTTNMLRSVYPKIISNFDIEVISYLEVLVQRIENLRPVRDTHENVVIHDSCVYARYESVVDEPRKLLERAGYKVVEPENSGKYTFCCGGPVESVYPDKALDIGRKRIDELKKYGSNVATMCPICLANLSRAAEGEVKIQDISFFLKEAFLK